MLRAQVIDDDRALKVCTSGWDRLAVMRSRPYCAPALMLAWWQHAAPAGSKLRVIVVWQGAEIVGVAPFFADRGFGGIVRYRVLGAREFSAVDLLADPHLESQVAEVFADSLSHVTPAPHVVMFEGLPTESRWPELIAHAWHGRQPSVSEQLRLPSPAIRAGGKTFEEWFQARSKNFRMNLMRKRRRLQEHGALVRMSTEETLAGDLESFAQLYYARWRRRGGSGILSQGMLEMLDSAGRSLIPELRFRLWIIEVDSKPISAALFVAAGGEVAYWLGAFDESWGKFQPALQVILADIGYAFTEQAVRIALGSGGQSYKYRFADEDSALRWVLLVPPTPWSVLAGAQLFPLRAHLFLAKHTPHGIKPIFRRALTGLSALRQRSS